MVSTRYVPSRPHDFRAPGRHTGGCDMCLQVVSARVGLRGQVKLIIFGQFAFRHPPLHLLPKTRPGDSLVRRGHLVRRDTRNRDGPRQLLRPTHPHRLETPLECHHDPLLEASRKPSIPPPRPHPSSTANDAPPSATLLPNPHPARTRLRDPGRLRKPPDNHPFTKIERGSRRDGVRGPPPLTAARLSKTPEHPGGPPSIRAPAGFDGPNLVAPPAKTTQSTTIKSTDVNAHDALSVLSLSFPPPPRSRFRLRFVRFPLLLLQIRWHTSYYLVLQ